MPNHAERTIRATPKPHNRLFNADPFELDVSRIIGGRKFSTSTAALACVIACCGTSQVADFHYERTGLYRSSRGAWFIAGEGGAYSRWGRRAIDGSRDAGEGLKVISQTEARRLLEQCAGPVEVFFESEEG